MQCFFSITDDSVAKQSNPLDDQNAPKAVVQSSGAFSAHAAGYSWDVGAGKGAMILHLVLVLSVQAECPV